MERDQQIAERVGKEEEIGTRVHLSLARQLAAWERLIAGLGRYRDELSHLEPQRRELAAALGEVKNLILRQQSLKAELQAVTRELHTQAARGRDSATRLRHGLRCQYGHRSRKLIEFGL